MVGSSVGDRSTALHQHLRSFRCASVPRQVNILCRHKTELAVRAIPRVTIGCNSTWLHDTVIMYYAEPQALFDHGINCSQLLELTMSITIDRKVAVGLLSKAATGNDLLAVLEMIVTSFTDTTVNTTPTMEEIEF